MKVGYNKDSCTPMFIAALFIIAKLWKQPRFPTADKWIKKMWYFCVHIYVNGRMQPVKLLQE
jgi:hypothetical protein